MRAIRSDGEALSALGALTPNLVARRDGAFLVRSAEPLPAYPSQLSDCLRRWAREAFRRWRPQVVAGQDVVANLHRRLAAMPHAEFDRLFRDALAKAHLLEPQQAGR